MTTLKQLANTKRDHSHLTDSDARALIAEIDAHDCGTAELLAALKEAESLLMLCDPHGDRMAAFGNRVAEDMAVFELCERHGYGAVMDSAARQWRLKADPPGGSYTTGPAVGSVQRGVAIIRAVLAKHGAVTT